MRNTNKRQGFTIVELVIVIAVIAILAGVLIPTFSNVIQKAKDSRDQQDALNIYKEQVLALKADNALEDTNKNGKEEVLVVLRENQTDVKYFLFVDGKMELKTTKPESAEYDLKVSNGTTTPGEEVVTYTLTKVTSNNILELEGKKVIIAAINEGQWYLMGDKSDSSEGKMSAISVGNGADPTFSDAAIIFEIKRDKDGESYNLKTDEGYLKKLETKNNLSINTTGFDNDDSHQYYVFDISMFDEDSIFVSSESFQTTYPEYSLCFYKNNNYFGYYKSSSTYIMVSLYIVTEN